MDTFEEDSPSYKIGRMDGDQRRFWKNRPLAQTFANQGQEYYKEKGVYSTRVYQEGGHGFVAVLYGKENLPEAWETGFEFFSREQMAPDHKATPEDWASPKKSQKKVISTANGTVTAPTGGVTARVWAIADPIYEAATDKADWKAIRPLIMAACEDAGINKATAGTQYSKWKKTKGS
jgi:hypothetical protein